MWNDNKACREIGNTVSLGGSVDNKEKCLSLCKAFDHSTVTGSIDHNFFCCDYDESKEACKIVSSSGQDTSDMITFGGLYTEK